MTSSRNPTPRPRRVAGTGGRGAGASERLETSQAEAPADPPVVEPAPDAVVEVRAPAGVVETTAAEAPAPEAVEPESADEAAAESPARKATVALVLAIVVLLAAALLQAAYLWGPLKDDPTVSSERPVLLSRAAERSATDTAAKAAVAFAQRSYETYDEQVDDAAAMMTADFEKQFRQTTDDARQRFIDAETQVTAEVAAQGVMTASEQQVEALVFLNQFTLRKGEESVFTPFRLKVTLIDTDRGWLVSDVDAT